MRWSLLRRANPVCSDLIMKGRPYLGDLLVMKGRPCLGWVSICGVHSTCDDGAFLNSSTYSIIFWAASIFWFYRECTGWVSHIWDAWDQNYFGFRIVLGALEYMHMCNKPWGWPRNKHAAPMFWHTLHSTCSRFCTVFQHLNFEWLITRGQVWGFPFMVSDQHSKVSNFGTFQIWDFGIGDAQPGL